MHFFPAALAGLPHFSLEKYLKCKGVEDLFFQREIVARILLLLFVV
jgi:hypothetical protein